MWSPLRSCMHRPIAHLPQRLEGVVPCVALNLTWQLWLNHFVLHFFCSYSDLWEALDSCHRMGIFRESSKQLPTEFLLFFLSLQLLTHIRSSTVAFAEAYPQHQKKSLLVFLCLTASSMYPIRRDALWVLLVGAYLKTEHFLWPEWIISSFKLPLKQETKCLESAKPPLLIAPKWDMFLVGRWTTGNSLNTEEVR